ncbi:fl(2)d-associated complex component [Hetaerina americana]|uniref:fl(2)d-associated complex component n=1 Tax=Hetaerina americana TaxID=62018 RepID=UPI003A7F3BD9
MALKGSPRRKDVKKSSYYVWFLGAKESRGLRGEEYVRPVVRHLLQKERDVEPFKVTLQVSNKGLKIIQNVPGKGVVTGKGGSSGAAGGKGGNGGSSGDIVKHFIPHHAVTCAVQDSTPNEDVVSAILLIYNPVTRCPVHVHSYRCDSVETATILRSQLQTLIERPENQRKFAEIESRLHAKGLLVPPGSPQRVGSPGEPPITVGSPSGGLHHHPHHQSNGRGGRNNGGGSDGRSSSTRESESSGSSERGNGHPASPPGGANTDRITSLYDSLAAELREKLGEVGSGGGGKKRHGPILLPPRDYDTVHRKHGNLTGIDLRRCLNANIVGVNARGSAAPLGPNAAVAAMPTGKKGVGPGSGSAHGAGYTLQQGGSSGGSSGIGSDDAPSPENDRESSDPRYLDNQSSSDEEWNERSGQPSAMSEDSMFLVQPTWQPKQTQQAPRQQSQQRPLSRDLSLPRARRLLSGGSDSAPSTNAPAYPPGPPSDANPTRRRRPEERQRSPSPGPIVGPLSPRERFQDAKEKFLLLERQRIEEQGRLVQKRREKERLGSPRGSSSQGGMPTTRSSGQQRAPRPTPRGTRHSRGREEWASEDEFEEEEGGDNYEEEPEEDEESERIRRIRARRPPPPPLHRLPSPPPDDDLEDPDLEEEEVFERVSGGYFGPRRAPEYRRSRENLLDAPPEEVVGHRGTRGSGGRYAAASQPPPSNNHHHPASPPRHPNLPPHLQQDKKRRSMFDVVEEERRRSSNELAKEFKRRSYHEPDIVEEGRRGGGRRSGPPPPPSGPGGNNYHELADHERYPGLDRETARMSHHQHAKAHRTPSEGTAAGGGSGGGRYRHSYAEPEMFHHRGSGRMGMAAIHPY